MGLPDLKIMFLVLENLICSPRPYKPGGIRLVYAPKQCKQDQSLRKTNTVYAKHTYIHR